MDSIATRLREARKKKGLSQRDLSQKLKKPQSYISKIENGLVDVQLSNLIEISRTLELEVMLIPREFIKTVQAMVAGRRTDEQIPKYLLDKEAYE